MALIGREHELEAINKKALRMAREVADETGTLMAGNISNSNIFVDTVPNYREKIMNMFKVILLGRFSCMFREQAREREREKKCVVLG